MTTLIATQTAPEISEVRSRVVALRDDIDWLIASYLNEELTANLYSARLHVMRCIKELNEEAK